MTKKRIQELADFFYSSNSANDVPLRISCCMGMSGFDPQKHEFIELMGVLNESKDLKNDLSNFINNVCE